METSNCDHRNLFPDAMIVMKLTTLSAVIGVLIDSTIYGVLLLWKSVFLQDCLKYLVICWILQNLLEGASNCGKPNLSHLVREYIGSYILIFLVDHHGFWYTVAVICFTTVVLKVLFKMKVAYQTLRRSFVQQRLLDIKRHFVSNTKLQSTYFERDELGWIIPNMELNQNLNIAELKGFVIDWNAADHPSIKMYYKPAENGNGLLSVDDIKTMLQLDPQELRRICFSLNRVNEVVAIDDNAKLLYLKQLCTIYQKVCTPQKLANTGIMETLFYADYIMKFLAVGSEVSANFPFNIQPISQLIQYLPKKLQHSLRSVPLRELQENQCICSHRFWIEVKQLDYQSWISDAKEYFYISSVETKVNTESLGRCPTRSGCKSFADDLTRHYPEVSQYLKVFARLPELAKLQFILIKANEQLAAKGYSLSLTDTQQGEFETKPDLVPSSWNTSFPVSGGVQMEPTYNPFPLTPTVYNSTSYENARNYGLSSLNLLAQTALGGPGGIRLQPHGVPHPQCDGSSMFDMENGLLSLELAMIASILIQTSNKKTN